MSLEDDLKQASDDSVKETDVLLAGEYNSLMQATKSDLDALRPKISDQATYDKLISVIDEATQNNLDLAAVQQRLEDLGTGVVQLGKEAASLLTL